MDRLNVVGLGYIGLPTALMFAASGVKVTGTDINPAVVDALRQGEMPFDEEGLKDLFSDALREGIEFSTKYLKTDRYVIAVPTPYDKNGKKLDASYVIQAVKNVLKVCEKGAVIIIESTISPGTVNRYIRPVLAEEGWEEGRDVHLAHAPERIIPGNMIYELKHNARTIGADNQEVGEKVKSLYASFCRGEIVATDIKTAEMSKVVENTYRDINIAFANELLKICRSDGMDVYEIIKIANRHPRVNILSPGPGVGGHCISVDPWFLVGDYPGLANIILAARKINDSMPEYVLERISRIMDEHWISGNSEVGLYGLTYKENVDDVRESPTFQLLECMKRHLAKGVRVYDPLVTEDLVENQYHDLNEFLEGVKLVVVMVAHDEILRNQSLLREKLVLDTKNVLDSEGVFKL